MPSEQEASAARKAFSEAYWKEPWQPYISSIGKSSIGTWMKEKAPKDRRDELCIVLCLVEEPPAHIVFPDSYDGVAILKTVTGRFEALANE